MVSCRWCGLSERGEGSLREPRGSTRRRGAKGARFANREALQGGAEGAEERGVWSAFGSLREGDRISKEAQPG